MNSVTFFHTRIFGLYAHFHRTLEKDQIETLLRWARIVLPKIGNVSIEAETLEVSVPEVKGLRITKGISDYASEIIVGIISAAVGFILTAAILKTFF